MCDVKLVDVKLCESETSPARQGRKGGKLVDWLNFPGASGFLLLRAVVGQCHIEAKRHSVSQE